MTRSMTERPHGAAGSDHPKAGGEHTDSLESGMPHDMRNPSAGASNDGVGVKPDGENQLERGDYPAPGEDTAGGGGHNHRILPTPSAEDRGPIGGRNIGQERGVIGGGRGGSGKFCGTMGRGATGEGKGKGYMGG